MKRIRIGTRASKLALVQANAIKSAIERKHAGISVEIIKIKTTGDKILDVPLAKIGGKGLFVKEIEEMLLRRDVDIAVHSMKDVPVEIPEGLGIVVTTKREDPRDVLISSDGRRLYELNNALIGTSSLRRQVQLKNILRSPIIENLRGNLDTRIRKLKEGRYDAVIVAMAGLRRMGLQAEVTEVIPTDVMLPAVGQGCLGIEAHMDNMEVRDRLLFLNDRKSAVEISAERAFLKTLGGGCQVPIAGYAELKNGGLVLRGLVASLDGNQIIEGTKKGKPGEAEKIGEELAKEMLESGAREVLKEVYGN